MGLFSKLQLLSTNDGRAHVNRRVQSWWRGESHLAVQHPLGKWALELCKQNEQQALEQLDQWITSGISFSDLQLITQKNSRPEIEPPKNIARHHRLELLAGSCRHWNTHTWLQHLPVQEISQLLELGSKKASLENDPPITLLLLEPIFQNTSLQVATLIHWWHRIQLAEQCIVSEHVLAVLLQGMGLQNIQSWPISEQTNGWLAQPEVCEQASRDLGLPPVRGLQAGLPVALGDAGPSYQVSLDDQLTTLPGWEFLLINNAEQARAQAAWLQELSTNQYPLVLLNPSKPEHVTAALPALQPEAQAVVLRGEFCQDSLLQELNWLSQGCPEPVLAATPKPPAQIVWNHKHHSGGSAQISVCISLHNYSHTIQRALESIRLQSLLSETIDLIVVDDASSDDGAERVQLWMERYGQQFQHCRLIQHRENGGLASARNTAFSAANASWCFVLDADNYLKPAALERCLSLAQHCNDQCAVVHPWIGIEQEQHDKTLQRQGLHGVALWQRERFLEGNHIDAMALVRHAAWEQVGGYTHIPGGWEDFDFWCCLIEAGWYGVCLPQVVCSYVVHNQSMLATSTNTNLRWLCRLLQQRHPWLELDPEATCPGGGAHRDG